jgi:hypothetical protein
MPQPVDIKRGKLQEFWAQGVNRVAPTTPSGKELKEFEVQFNPQTLKLTYSNQTTGGDQPIQGNSIQFSGRGSTKLALELWFDVTLAMVAGRVNKATGKSLGNVRALTQEVSYFMTPQDAKVKAKETDPKTKKETETLKTIKVPPGVRFIWGDFTFEGVMESLDETIDYFSPDGIPLRASVNVSISRLEINYDPELSQTLAQPGAPGRQPLQAANLGDSLQQIAAKAGISNWQSIATANNVDNPRQLGAGTLLNLSM